ncbi:MAG: TetR/AcrR family transcriptional regulator [Aquificaceae bacterium]
MRRKETKEKILKASLKLFSEKGIRETTIKDIAKEVGITEGAIYRHFRSKEEIVLGLFQSYSEELYKRLIPLVKEEAPYKERFYKAVDAFLSFAFENPSAFKYLNIFHYLRADSIKGFDQLPKDALLSLIERGIEEDFVRIKKEYALAVFVGTLERVFLLVEAGVLNKEEVKAEEMANIIWKALS